MRYIICFLATFIICGQGIEGVFMAMFISVAYYAITDGKYFDI